MTGIDWGGLRSQNTISLKILVRNRLKYKPSILP